MNSVKILVVDDNLINQKVAVKMLERSKFKCDTAYNGLEAVAAVQKQRYDLILMDVQMPEMDGLEATKVIRTMEVAGSHTPIVAVTANAMIGDRERCLQAGMDDYLSKPILQSNIDEIIKKWVPGASQFLSGAVQQSDTSLPTIIDSKRIEQIKEIGDVALLRELMTMYLEDLKQFSLVVISASNNDDFQQIYESTHKLKGSSANLGVESIRQACILLEQYAQEQQREKIAGHMNVMQDMIEQTRHYIVKTYIV